ncbi:hypothetical protein R1sor_004643 [Riccia sorocarpa]|uniref:Uncharacterized protein n=1 Tax=Riccia sorocarpa TaxID=122646 RepID=A0ABD3HHI8_9MARC
MEVDVEYSSRIRNQDGQSVGGRDLGGPMGDKNSSQGFGCSHVEKCESVFGGVIGGRKGSGSGSSAGNMSEKQKNAQAVAGAANPAGFKGWSSFTGKKRAGEDGDDSHKGRAAEAMGEVSPTNEQKIDAKKWAIGVTWDMIAAELELLLVITEDEEGSDGATRVFEMDVDKAAIKVGQLRRLAVVLQTLESVPVGNMWIIGLGRSEEDRAMTLADPPKFLDGKLIRLVQWRECTFERNCPKKRKDLPQGNLRTMGDRADQKTAEHARQGGLDTSQLRQNPPDNEGFQEMLPSKSSSKRVSKCKPKGQDVDTNIFNALQSLADEMKHEESSGELQV